MNCRATTDYAKAGATMRGVAGVLVFVVEGIELPGGLRIVGRQVKAGSRTLDFALETPTGKRTRATTPGRGRSGQLART